VLANPSQKVLANLSKEALAATLNYATLPIKINELDESTNLSVQFPYVPQHI
jgi:hypothetical protein